MTDDTLPQTEQNFVSRLLLQVPGLAECVTAAKRLNAVLRRKSKEALDKVLDEAAGTALGSFVTSLRRDISAVQAALDLPWTTSPAEGPNKPAQDVETNDVWPRRLRPAPRSRAARHITQRQHGKCGRTQYPRHDESRFSLHSE